VRGGVSLGPAALLSELIKASREGQLPVPTNRTVYRWLGASGVQLQLCRILKGQCQGPTLVYPGIPW